MNIDFERGGALVIDRIIQAYGFKTKLEFSNHLGTSASNLSSRYKKDLFPSDLVVRCMAETGATLQWLATGEGDFLPTEEKPKETVLSDETLEKLERLSTLRKDGILSEEELIELKAKLI